MSVVDNIVPFLAIVNGKSYSGKSVLIKFMIYELKDKFHQIYVFSATRDCNSGYNYLPDKYVYKEFKPEVLHEIIEQQEMYKKAGKDINILIVFDDCIGMKDFDSKKPNPDLLLLITAGRHIGISLIYSVQHYRYCPLVCRNNATFNFIFRQTTTGLETLYEELSTVSKNEFYDFITEHTDNWGVVRYNARERDSSLQWSVFKVPESFMSKKFVLKY